MNRQKSTGSAKTGCVSSLMSIRRLRPTAVSPGSVQVVGVSKYVDAATTRMLIAAGCHCLGESRPQVLWQKAEELSTTQRGQWHLIGHLQRNKVRRLLKCDPCIESVDSQRLLRRSPKNRWNWTASHESCWRSTLVATRPRRDWGRTSYPALGVVASRRNRSRRTDGHGGLGNRFDRGPKAICRNPVTARSLMEQTGVPLPHLSMGMSGDFREAIAEGATIVRIGSRLFEGVME